MLARSSHRIVRRGDLVGPAASCTSSIFRLPTEHVQSILVRRPWKDRSAIFAFYSPRFDDVHICGCQIVAIWTVEPTRTRFAASDFKSRAACNLRRKSEWPGKVMQPERRKTEQRPADRFSEEKILAGQMALEMMHEVRNLAEAANLFVYMGLLEAEDAGRVRIHLTSAEQHLAALSKAVKQPLNFARSSEGLKQTDLISLLDAIVRVHQETIDNKKIHLVRKHPQKLTADLHEGEVLQVVSNLVINALESLPDEGKLHLRLVKRNEAVCLVVADTGPGIPDENIERIFEPFFTTKAEKGAGLGLALSKRIIERRGGSIKVRSSTTEGRSGTIFRVCLPA
jgi:signal transduction histidine kinase